MSQAPAVWTPPTDDELFWFRPGGPLPQEPGPLEYTLEVQAFVFGLSHALESLNFPLYSFRSRLFDGHLYLASVPSGLAERDLPTRMRLVEDSSLRFTRGTRRPWEQDVRGEVEGYNRWIAQAFLEGQSSPEMAEQLRRLRRVRGNQWYAMIRAVAGPTAMLEHRLQRMASGAEAREGLAAAVMEARATLREGLALVRGQGEALTEVALRRVGARLAAEGSIERADHLWWLEWREVRESLLQGTKCRALVAERRRAAEGAEAVGSSPETLGPPLAPDNPQMYLVREILALLAE